MNYAMHTSPTVYIQQSIMVFWTKTKTVK